MNAVPDIMSGVQMTGHSGPGALRFPSIQGGDLCGRLATSGAISGPIVKADLQIIYLNDITIYGCTHQSPEVFAEFVAKRCPGKLVLIP